jgi:hypothetical protein
MKQCLFYEVGVELPTIWCNRPERIRENYASRRTSFHFGQRVSNKTVCLTRNVSIILGIIRGTIENYFMNLEAWNLKGYAGYVRFFTKINLFLP